MINSQGLQSQSQGFCVASRHYRRNYSHPLEHDQPVAIMHVKSLECFALFSEVQGTVRHHPINVKENHAQVLRLQKQLG